MLNKARQQPDNPALATDILLRPITASPAASRSVTVVKHRHRSPSLQPRSINAATRRPSTAPETRRNQRAQLHYASPSSRRVPPSVPRASSATRRSATPVMLPISRRLARSVCHATHADLDHRQYRQFIWQLICALQVGLQTNSPATSPRQYPPSAGIRARKCSATRHRNSESNARSFLHPHFFLIVFHLRRIERDTQWSL